MAVRPIRILLVDDHAVVRNGFRMILGSQPDMEVVGEASNGRQAIAMADTTHPEVVVMDITMPELNGIEATRQIAHVLPHPRTLKTDFLMQLFRHRSQQGDRRLIEQGIHVGR